jgi:hypothetical protein
VELQKVSRKRRYGWRHAKRRRRNSKHRLQTQVKENKEIMHSRSKRATANRKTTATLNKLKKANRKPGRKEQVVSKSGDK